MEPVVEYIRHPITGCKLIKKNCEVCGKEFGAYPGNVAKGMGRYCSILCARRGIGNRLPETHTCPQCNGAFKVFVSRVAKGKGKFCSKACYTENMKAQKSPRSCDHCGQFVDVLPYRHTRQHFYCSRPCFYNARKTGGWTACENPECNNTVYRSSRRKRTRKHVFCSMKCRSAVVHGPNHHLWEGGIDPHDKRKGHEFSSHTYRLILERDQYSCQECGDYECDVLHVDHVLAICNGGSNDISNGRTLCVKCHNKKSTGDRRINREMKMAA